MMETLSETQSARLAERATPRQDGFEDVVLPDLPELPGMVSPPERRYLYWLTSRGYAGAGAVVELGPWLGRSTIHLAMGLRENGYHDVLHSYDRFIWDALQGTKASLPLQPGDDFQPYFERHVRPIYPQIQVHRQDLHQAVWSGEPIEILFMDAPKRLPMIGSTLAAFGPSLIPGTSVIVMQDYLHFASYAIAVVMCTLGDCLEPIHVVVGGSTVTMAVRKPLDLGAAQPLALNFRNWSTEKAMAVWARVLEPLHPVARARLEPGLAMLLHDLGDIETAVDWLKHLDQSDRLLGQWRRFAKTSLYPRYRPLFEALGIEGTYQPPQRQLERTARPLAGRLRDRSRSIYRQLRSMAKASLAVARKARDRRV